LACDRGRTRGAASWRARGDPLESCALRRASPLARRSRARRTMKTTSLHETHARLGAKLIEFGGWHMPVQYGPILDEVRCVRRQAGLFDLGHMGRIHVSGKDAIRFLDRVAT